MKNRFQIIVVMTLVAININQVADASNLPMADDSRTRPVVHEQAPPLVDVAPAPALANIPESSFSDSSEAPLVPAVPDLVMASKVNPSLIKGEFEKVVCISEGTLAVRTKDLKDTIFVAKRGQKAKVFQGWGDVKKKKTINSQTYTFVKVQIDGRDERDENIGWVAENYIKAKTACPMLPQRKTHASADVIPDSKDDSKDNSGAGHSGKGLKDPDCCRFPLNSRPSSSFLDGVLRFGAERAAGRKHAACDLYLDKGSAIKAVTGGKIIRGLYYFYQGTYALEVKHDGGFVVRYGEITGKKADNTSLGNTIKVGQQVGSMGKVNSNCCEPMLHFELYRGDKSGPLSQGRKGFQRRSDLLNPTDYLTRWEDNI